MPFSALLLTVQLTVTTYTHVQYYYLLLLLYDRLWYDNAIYCVYCLCHVWGSISAERHLRRVCCTNNKSREPCGLYALRFPRISCVARKYLSTQLKPLYDSPHRKSNIRPRQVKSSIRQRPSSMMCDFEKKKMIFSHIFVDFNFHETRNFVVLII